MKMRALPGNTPIRLEQVSLLVRQVTILDRISIDLGVPSVTVEMTENRGAECRHGSTLSTTDADLR